MGSNGESAPQNAWLSVQAGTDRGRRFAVKNGRTTIGRGIDNDVVLTDIAVSRRHLIIDSDPQGFVMSDLGSGNGTLVNDRDQDGTYRLGHGDRLELGNTVLVFECQELPARAPVPALPRPTAPPPPQVRGKWARQHADDDDQSTVAGKKPVPLKMTAPMPAPRMPAQGGGAPTGQRGQPSAPPPPQRRQPTAPPPMPLGRRTSTGAAVEPQPSMLSMPPTPSVPHGAIPTRDPHPVMPIAGAHMPTMAADVLGLGGLTNATPQPPMQQMPPMGSGFSPFPGAGLSYPSPPHGFGIGGPTPHPPPRFQYPQGVMSPSPGGDRKRVLIGILAIAFVAVGAGIVMALVHGRGGDAKTAASAPVPTTAPAPTPAPAAAPVVTPGAPVVTPGAPAAAGAVAGTDDKVTLASLMGTKDLTPDSFGNDEQILASAGKSPAPEEDEADEPPPSSGKQQAKAPEKRAEKRAPERATRPTRKEKVEDEEDEEDEEPEEDSRPSSGAEVDVDVATTKAEKQYKSKQFADAAATLRRAADGGAGKKEAQRLRAAASRYETVGNLLKQGGDESDPPRALTALKKAHGIDGELEGALDSFIGVKIGNIAPNAAKAYMARGKFADAKLAADDAQSFGNGAAVASVRSSLEARAGELYDRANAAAADGDDAKAADLARQAMKLVPKSSPVYAKAAKLAKK
jgi:tetratricopeptide (TPR) repeat protein